MDLITVGVIVGTVLIWGGLIMFFLSLRKERSIKFKSSKKKSKQT